ncbi:PilW family protein [Deinococcus knuensis]|uniref:Prepilin-type N-terminal cleavage/methylation domain-containing protein n=1 Tax=Deinococcus knuensis TaxID=1837380 RepID=A0ABQ2STI0_9DEIO|nr:prepilin-type N-terminal cleavage/methylation domain-containing protein [Deinococcus knuensis]GGS39847.1 hypothetical protein GCM10008961_33990 [Deinococcus knuensis]
MKGVRAGVTLTELLITMAVGVIIVTAVLNLVFGAQRLYQVDSARAAVNQNASVALNAMTNELRQAGERLPRDFPALEVSGDSGEERIVMRRGVIDTVLPVCRSVKAGTGSVVFISMNGAAKGTAAPAGCAPSSSDAGFGAWTAYRAAHGGAAQAFLLDPVTGVGELFTYAGEDGSGQHVRRGAGQWLNDYPVENSPRLYLIEQLAYQRREDTLTRQEGERPAEPYLPGVTGFDVQPVVNVDGSDQVVTGAFPAAPLSWKDLVRLDIVLAAQQRVGGRSAGRTFISSFIPRNVFSEDQ